MASYGTNAFVDGFDVPSKPSSPPSQQLNSFAQGALPSDTPSRPTFTPPSGTAVGVPPSQYAPPPQHSAAPPSYGASHHPSAQAYLPVSSSHVPPPPGVPPSMMQLPQQPHAYAAPPHQQPPQQPHGIPPGYVATAMYVPAPDGRGPPQLVYALQPAPGPQPPQQPPHHASPFTPPSHSAGPPAPQMMVPQAPMPRSDYLPFDDGPKQLIVNFLDPDVTNAELHAAFSAIGPLDAARVIYDKLTSRSKGFGFVYFKSSRDAAAAVQCMTGHPLRGRRIKVSFANPQRPMPTMDAAF